MVRCVRKSDAFYKRLTLFTRSYREQAGEAVALRFVSAVDRAINFICENPEACRLDSGAASHEVLKHYAIRSWRIKGFPYSIYFRMDADTLLLETIYAHKMDREPFYTEIK